MIATSSDRPSESADPGDHAESSLAGRIVAVSISPGGVPKLPIETAVVTQSGIDGDLRNHEKHIRPDRALSLLDDEIRRDLIAEGFPLEPGTAGENLTVAGLNVQQLTPGTVLSAGDVLIRLEFPRKPCYVLDKIDPRLKEAIVGRCGYMASVLHGGTLQAGMAIQISTDAPPCE
jgi:MOSC domain-containing protein YiiM